MIGLLLSDLQGPAEQRALPPGLTRRLGQNAGADHLQHPGHRGQNSGADCHHVGGEMFDPARIDDLAAEAWKQELPDRMFVAVRDGKIGQVALVAKPQRTKQGERAVAVRKNRTVRQDHAFGRAARAGRVEHAGWGFGSDIRDARSKIRQGRGSCQFSPCCRVGRGAIHDHDRTDQPGTAERFGQDPGRYDRGPRPRITHDVRLVLHRVADVRGNGHQPECHQCGLGDDVFGAVLRDHHNPIALGKTRTGPPGRCRLDVAGEFRPGDGVPRARSKMPQHRPVGPFRRAAEHHRRQARPGWVGLHVASSPFDAPGRGPTSPRRHSSRTDIR